MTRTRVLRYLLKEVKNFLIAIFCLLGLQNKLRREWARLRISAKDIVIIANGPSFNDEIAKKLKENRSKFILIVLNAYIKNDVSSYLRPDFYVLSDPNHPVGLLEQIAAYSKKHRVKCITPKKGALKDYFDNPLLFDDRQCLLLKNQCPWRPRGYPSNTTFKAIACAKFLTTGGIYLFGFDYNISQKLRVDSANDLYLKDEHHYGSKARYVGHLHSSVSAALIFWGADLFFAKRLNSRRVLNITNTSLVDFLSRKSPPEFFAELENLDIKSVELSRK